jgi:type II secretory pathway component PulF
LSAYRFRAARADGEQVAGVLEAASEAAAASELAGRGLFTVELNAAGGDGPQARGMRRAELAAAFGGLAALLEAGMPLDRALASVAEDASARVAPVFSGARRRVSEGSSLSAALRAEGGVPPVVVGLLKAGEAYGRLGVASRRAAVQLERDAELAADIRGALAYPVFLAAVGGFSVMLIVGVVVPRFASLLGDLGQVLPPSTRLLLGLGDVVAAHGPLGALLLLGLALVFARAVREGRGRLLLHETLMTVPVVGAIRLGLATTRLCRALAGLVESGVPLLSALDHAGGAAGDLAVSERLARAKRDVTEGEGLAVALRRHGAASLAALRLVRYGEESGRLSEMLEKAAALEEAAARRALRSLVALIEPVMIVLFALLVAFVAAALLQAVYSVRPAGF